MNMALQTQAYKGARDFYPEDKRIQDYMFNVMRSVCGGYGYEEYDAPILEPTELYLSKGNEEIIQEQTYTFQDRGDRSVTMRTEMTPTVSRMVAGKRQELAYPLRWFSIPQCWRYERMQRGRGREFYQLNVDIFGVQGIEADHEVILCADTILQRFKAKRDMYRIQINSRKLVNSLMHDVLGLDETQAQTMIRLIDRMHKMDWGEFVGQVDGVFGPTQRENGETDLLLNFLKATSLKEIPEQLQKLDATQDITRLIAMLEASGISNAVFDPSLMRGFDYYTDIVFEVFDTHPDNNRAMFGGGRYSGMMELFGAEQLEAVGFGMGDYTLINFLESHNLLPQLHSGTDIYVVLIGDVYEKAQAPLRRMRELGLKVAVDVTGRKLDKQIKTALKKDIHYVMFIGETELEAESYPVKNLRTGKEEKHGIERLVSVVSDYRQDDEDLA